MKNHPYISTDSEPLHCPLIEQKPVDNLWISLWITFQKLRVIHRLSPFPRVRAHTRARSDSKRKSRQFAFREMA
jgi:hypothetical protein